MFKLSRFLKKYKKQVILGPAFKLVEAVFELIVPLVMAQIIDVGIAQGDVGYIFRMGGIMVLLGVTGLCSTLVCQKFAAVASQGFGTDLRNSLFSHISSLSHTELDKLGTPSIITRLTNDVNQMQSAVAMLIRLVVRAPFLVVGAVIMAMITDFQLSIVFLVISPLVAAAVWLVMKGTLPFYKIMQSKLDRISMITKENLQGARVVRSFGKAEEEINRFKESTEDYTKTAVTAGRIYSLMNPMTYAILNLGILAVIYFGGQRVFDGALMQGHIIAFVNYMFQILTALVVVANLVVLFTKASASAARINEVFDLSPSVVFPDNDNAVSENKTGRKGPNAVTQRPEGYADVFPEVKIEFRNVSFSYEPGGSEEDLSGINLKIYRGQTVGIIGATGSGKSTLVSLIPRFYDVTDGGVFIDGSNVKNYTKETLRNKIGIVPQRAVLFSGTVADNLKMGKKDASEKEMWDALKISQGSEFIERLPDRLETRISQSGQNLSGGQKQRLTIARAVIRAPEILILDDSSSALDYATDAALRSAIKDKFTDGRACTVIMISQRVNSIQHADNIVVLDDGKIAGQGSHDNLLETCEIYKEIYLSQMQ